MIIPSTIRDLILLSSIILTSKKYLPGFRFEVLAEVIEMASSPFEASVIVKMKSPEQLAELNDFLN